MVPNLIHSFDTSVEKGMGMKKTVNDTETIMSMLKTSIDVLLDDWV